VWSCAAAYSSGLAAVVSVSIQPLREKTVMKNPLLSAAIVACALSSPILAADDKAPTATPAMGMDMDRQMSQMQASMKIMQQQMERLRTTTDPRERQKLMQQHMQAMQDHMKMMRGMGGPMMSGGATGMGGPMKMGDGMAMGERKGMADDDMMRHHDMLEKRVDMLQMMMEQMKQHDRMQESGPAK